VSGFHIPITVSLTVIFISLAVAVVASVMFGRNRREQALENI
jgi:tellurite resistance protein TerC